MTFLEVDGSECGVATYTSPHGFSFTIDSPGDAGTGGGSGAGGASYGTLPDAGGGGPQPVPYGTFSEVIAPGSDAFDVTCPTGETHHFNLFEVEGQVAAGGTGSQGLCPMVQDLVPQASLIIQPGGIDVAGAVSFTIDWPPIGPNVDYPSNALQRQGTPLKPVAVTYFNCVIPAAPETCQDGIQDGAETDIDCGGKESKPSCPARCQAGQKCIVDCDCDDSLVCVVEAGIRVCDTEANGGVPSADGGATSTDGGADGDGGTCGDGGTGADGGPCSDGGTNADGGADAGAPQRNCNAYLVCNDGLQEGDETDVDCGGSYCPPCAQRAQVPAGLRLHQPVTAAAAASARRPTATWCAVAPARLAVTAMPARPTASARAATA